MSDTFLTAMLQNTFSFSDFYQRADILQRFLEHFFFENAKNDEDRVAALRQFYKDRNPETLVHVEAVAAWGGDLLGSFTKENLYERMHVLKQSVQELPQLTLYLPVRLFSKQTERIGAWCRENLQPTIMLETHIDPDTVGGCAVVYNSVYHDLSFSYFAKKEQPELMKLVSEYGR